MGGVKRGASLIFILTLSSVIFLSVWCACVCVSWEELTLIDLINRYMTQGRIQTSSSTLAKLCYESSE